MPALKSAKSGLSQREMDFLDRVSVVGRIVSRPGITFGTAIKLTIDSFPGMNEAEARKWINKARNALANGYAREGDLQAMRAAYVERLEELIATVRDHVVKDEVELTVKHSAKSARDAAANGLSEPEPDEVKKKIRPAAFNPAAVEALRKLLKEWGQVTGARPADGPKRVTNNLINNGEITLPGSRTAELANDQLARLAFGQAIEVVEPAAPGGTDVGSGA